MDHFDVPVNSVDVLKPSHLVSELTDATNCTESFPVLVDNKVHTFHEIDGGFVDDGDYHLVRLTFDHGGIYPGDMELESKNYELHLGDKVWSLTVSNVCTVEDGGQLLVYLHVDGYEQYPYTFQEEMRDDVDRRETRYTYSGDE